LIGIIEFALIAVMGPGHLGLWFLIPAVIVAAMAWASQSMFRRARHDQDNDSYFRSVAPAGWRDHAPTIAAVGMFLSVGAYLLVSADQGWPALLAVLGANATVVMQFQSTDRFWTLATAVTLASAADARASTDVSPATPVQRHENAVERPVAGGQAFQSPVPAPPRLHITATMP
jgi:hypothetical protein